MLIYPEDTSELFPAPILITKAFSLLLCFNVRETVTTYVEEAFKISGLPPHKLPLKEGCPVVLLRKLDPKKRLCKWHKATDEIYL
jgi:hypothetical protein